MNIHHLIQAHGQDAARNMVPEKERHLIDIAAEVLACEAFDEEVGFLYSGWCMTALPHRRPPVEKEFQPWLKENGRFRLMIEPGFTFNPKWESTQVGIPYGSRARLILFYLQTEAIRGQTPEVNLGPSLSSWLGRMGISKGGLSYQAVREQCRRLSSCRLTIGWNADDGSRGFERVNIVNKMMFIPATDDERQGSLWNETVRLSPEFFQSLVSHPVPVAEQGIKLLCNSSLSMDIYVWLAYRLRSLSKPATVSWAALHQQFGSEYSTVRAFRARFNENLREALCVYPDAKIDVTPIGVVLHPSPPAIPDRIVTKRLRSIV